jgi:hypothetical protein
VTFILFYSFYVELYVQFTLFSGFCNFIVVFLNLFIHQSKNGSPVTPESSQML